MTDYQIETYHNVSIHARLATGDDTPMPLYSYEQVSIHARLATGDDGAMFDWSQIVFQFTPVLRRATS